MIMSPPDCNVKMSPLAEIDTYRALFLMEVLDAERGDIYHERDETLRGDTGRSGEEDDHCGGSGSTAFVYSTDQTNQGENPTTGPSGGAPWEKGQTASSCLLCRIQAAGGSPGQNSIFARPSGAGFVRWDLAQKCIGFPPIASDENAAPGKARWSFWTALPIAGLAQNARALFSVPMMPPATLCTGCSRPQRTWTGALASAWSSSRTMAFPQAFTWTGLPSSQLPATEVSM